MIIGKNGKIKKNFKVFLNHYRQVHHIINLIKIITYLQFHTTLHCLILDHKFFPRLLKISPKL